VGGFFVLRGRGYDVFPPDADPFLSGFLTLIPGELKIDGIIPSDFIKIKQQKIE